MAVFRVEKNKGYTVMSNHHGFYEECFKNNKEIPMVMIVRLKKVKRDTLQ